LLILPIALAGMFLWIGFAGSGASFRLFASFVLLPVGALFFGGLIFAITARRLLHPPDVGSEGKEVVDADQEMQHAVGLVIQRGQFPDNLFAPAKRDDLLDDGVNPVFDKEMRSEIFSQGTLMLRIVIQMSMLLAIPLMFVCFYYTHPEWAPWYVNYVLLFNVLVGPVFSAGSVTGERERETLELLLTTILSPWQILWAKLVSGLRVSSVLTLFLVWPLILACVMVTKYWTNLPAMVWYLLIIVMSCITTGTLALFCSVLFRKTSVSLMTAYLLVIVLFMGPVAASYFADTFIARSEVRELITQLSFTSPFSAALSVPLKIDGTVYGGVWPTYLVYLLFSILFDAALLGIMTWLFHVRWRVAQE
jgi:ABC-type transport system involved in multi-copper enzyme maturation permease subunit